MKKILQCGAIAGIVLSIISYGGLFLAIQFFPQFFVEYNNPLFNSDGSRDALFYAHAFVISFALSLIWERFKSLFKGNMLVRGLEFGVVYGLTALVPVMWISFSAMDITVTMVGSWLLYGLIQSTVAGVLFAKINP